jgi:chromosome segregation ATPase
MLKPDCLGMVTVLVTKMDRFQPVGKWTSIDIAEEDIRKVFNEDASAERVLFSHHEMNKEELVNAICEQVKDLPPRQLEYTDDERVQHFGVRDSVCGQKKNERVLPTVETSKVAEISLFSDRLSNLSNQLDAVSRLNGEYESRLAEKETLTSTLKSEVNVLKERERDLIGHLKLSEELIADLRSKLKSADMSIMEAKINIESLEKDCSCWRTQVNDLEVVLAQSVEMNSKQNGLYSYLMKFWD